MHTPDAGGPATKQNGTAPSELSDEGETVDSETDAADPDLAIHETGRDPNMRDGAPLDLSSGSALVITERSVWVVEATRYRRMPRREFADRPANNTYSVENRLEDNRWHPHHEARWEQTPHGFRLAIKPDAGPADGFGIRTGIVERVLKHG